MNRIHIPNFEIQGFTTLVIETLKDLKATEKDFRKVTREFVVDAIINHISPQECAENILKDSK